MHDDIDLKAVRCFVALSEELNFSRAATRMAITQPSFSSQIRKLEQRIGLQLFERSTRQVTITSAGLALLDPARTMLEDARLFAQAAAYLAPENASKVVLGAPFYLYGIAEHDELLELLRTRIPNLRLTVDNDFNQTLVGGLLGGQVDLAMVLATPIPAADWRARTAKRNAGELEIPDNLTRIVLREETVALAVPAEHRFAQHDVIPADALAGAKIAMLSDAHGSTICDPIRDILQRSGAEVIVPPEAHDIALERLCRQRRIPAISVGWFRDVEQEDIVYRRIEGLDVASQLVLVRGVGQWRSEFAKNVWEVAESHFDAA